MVEIKINGKALYTPKGAAREYGRVGCNFYTGCPHECSYCYLKRGAPSKQLGGNVVQLKKCFKDEDNALEVFCREIEKHREVLKKTGVFFSFTTDPMIKETIDLTLWAIGRCVFYDIPVKVLTKNADFINYTEFRKNFAYNAYKNLVSIGFTLTGRDDMEPNASSNFSRIWAMSDLKEQGFKTWASIEPVIDWESAKSMINMSIKCCDHYKIGLRSGVKKDYYKLFNNCTWIDRLTWIISAAGRTVYLKESTRELLRSSSTGEFYNRILSRTVDMDGNEIIIKNE